MENKDIRMPECLCGEVECEAYGKRVSMNISVHPKSIRVEMTSPEHRVEERFLVLYAPLIYTEEPCEGSGPSATGKECIRQLVAQMLSGIGKSERK